MRSSLGRHRFHRDRQQRAVQIAGARHAVTQVQAVIGLAVCLCRNDAFRLGTRPVRAAGAGAVRHTLIEVQRPLEQAARVHFEEVGDPDDPVAQGVLAVEGRQRVVPRAAARSRNRAAIDAGAFIVEECSFLGSC